MYFDPKNRIENTLALDFETVPDGKIYHIGAVYGEKTFVRKDIHDLEHAFHDLDRFAGGAHYVLGHNVIRHDLDMAKRMSPGASFLKLPVIDTLFLSPLAFPENPYHKLIKDYKIVRSSKNDPVADSHLALDIFHDQIDAFRQIKHVYPKCLEFYAFAFKNSCSPGTSSRFQGLYDVMRYIAGPAPEKEEAYNIYRELTKGKICHEGLASLLHDYNNSQTKSPLLAYVLSWILVSGSNSVIPPWVKREFPKISGIIKKLRYSCGGTTCEFCKEHNKSEKVLKKYFGFDSFRTLPDGRTLQKEIVESGLKGEPLLGILPTGGGKSLCYQIPALHRYERLGELTLVISPLKALMKDQVDNLNNATGREVAAAINGSLTMPERGSVMEKVRLGDVGILYLSPEQLRNRSVANLIRSRDIGCFVFDEAHCLSKWGHDFRPDYLHVSDFISNACSDDGVYPLACAYTATAKKDVVEEIQSHFNEKLSCDMKLFAGGVERQNLNFQVWPVTHSEKDDSIFNLLTDVIEGKEGSAIVYCGTRSKTEKLSVFLKERGLLAEAFHAGKSEPDKRNIQDDFIRGDIPVICATNAFGMGIDKKDIRLVIHADIPGSLENYLQEAGRAGRDMEHAECILLYEEEDIQDQFALNSWSRISIKDIRAMLSILKKREKKTPEIIITPGEIMRLAGYGADSANDSKAKSGISWLERKGFLERTFNQTLFFQGVPLVKDMKEARERLDRLNLSKTTRTVYETILMVLFNSSPDAIISADDICYALGSIKDLPDIYADSRQVIAILSQMAQTGIVKEGLVMTAFVRPRGKGNSPVLLSRFIDAENKMLSIMQDMEPEAGVFRDEPVYFNLRLMSQKLKEGGCDDINPELVFSLLKSIAGDKGEQGGRSIKISGRAGLDQRIVYVRFPWDEIRRRTQLRHHVAGVILEKIVSLLPDNLKSGHAQVLSKFFLSDLQEAMSSDIVTTSIQGDAKPLIEQSLLFLHDLKIITIQNGLGVFRQAMTIKLLSGSKNRTYTQGDYEPLEHHFEQKNVQVHVMEKYARLGIEKIKTALRFVTDYFSSDYDRFVKDYFPGEDHLIGTAMTAEHYKKIIQNLENPVQEAIVAAKPDQNILILAGPGSGKTRTVVHRCAWLIKAKSVKPSSILVLCFNHRAMLELKKRIRHLAGKSGSSVSVMTYHGFAMRITGRSFLEPSARKGVFQDILNFDDIIDEALDLLNGKRELAGMDASETREQILSGYRHILVDEYQDIDARQYAFISALTGRLEKDQDSAISIMAVGDDDQSIYGFRKANVVFIQKFQVDYQAQVFYLMENYRSSYPVIKASDSLISLNRDRMKTDHASEINSRRKGEIKAPDLYKKDELVQIVHAKNLESQALFVAQEINKIIGKNSHKELEGIAVLSRHGISYPPLVAMRMALSKEGLDYCYSLKQGSEFPLFRVREFQRFMDYLDKNKKCSKKTVDLKNEVLNIFHHENVWTTQVEAILKSWCDIHGDRSISVQEAKAFALEILLEEKREQKNGRGVFLGTVHSVKGMEFPHVFILDSGWGRGKDLIRTEEERRLYYVGMTRAEKRLYLLDLENSGNIHVPVLKKNTYTLEKLIDSRTINGYSEDLTITILGMKDLFISYPGLFHNAHEIHRNLALLSAGDKVLLIEENGKIFLKNSQGSRVSMLSRSATLIWLNRVEKILGARVLAMIKRTGEDDAENTVENILVDSWELPIVEILHFK